MSLQLESKIILDSINDNETFRPLLINRYDKDEDKNIPIIYLISSREADIEILKEFRNNNIYIEKVSYQSLNSLGFIGRSIIQTKNNILIVDKVQKHRLHLLKKIDSILDDYLGPYDIYSSHISDLFKDLNDLI